jgi:NDP-sugar pyrophosphorylase family protein
MKAMILAAGFGNRLWPLTQDRAKPAIPFLGRPLIAYSVDYLKNIGISDLIINLHYQGDSIRKALGDGSAYGVKIHYSEEEEILGPSGGIDKVRDLLMEDDFVVVNGKIVTDIDLQAAIQSHKERNAIATMVLKENRAREHFSIVEVDERGWISHFAGFPNPGDTTPPAPLMFVSIHIMSPRIFEYIPRHCFSDSVRDVYPAAMRAGEAIVGYVAEGNWYEFSTLTRYLELSLCLLAEQGEFTVQGANCKIASNVRMENAILWDNVTVEAGATLRNVVLGEGVMIPAGMQLERAVVVRREIVHKGPEERQKAEIERIEETDENVIVYLK